MLNLFLHFCPFGLIKKNSDHVNLIKYSILAFLIFIIFLPLKLSVTGSYMNSNFSKLQVTPAKWPKGALKVIQSFSKFAFHRFIAIWICPQNWRKSEMWGIFTLHLVWNNPYTVLDINIGERFISGELMQEAGLIKD